MQVFHMKTVLLGIVFAGFSAQALAHEPDIICTFEVECFEAEACDEAAFELTLKPGPEEGTRMIRTIAERTIGTVQETETGTSVWQASTPSTVQILSWKLEEAARYTLHLTDGPAVVTYHGLCELEEE